MDAAGKAKLNFRETSDYPSMRTLALESGLEDGNFDEFLKAFGFFDGDNLVACAGLQMKGTYFAVECLAVRQEYRKMGLGRHLVRSVEDEARSRGASRLWAVARSPEFFEAIGYHRSSAVSPNGPNLDGCMSCRQRGHGCNPAIVVKMLS